MKWLLWLLLLTPMSSFADNLICFGDSQTAIRTPLIEQDTYCYKMAQALGVTPVNKGVGGNTTSDALTRLSADVLTQPGSCVTVMFGANDSNIDNTDPVDYSTWWTAPKPARIPLDTFTANLTSIVQQILSAGKNVTLITPWPTFSTKMLNQEKFYDEAVKGVGVNFGIPVLDASNIMRQLWWGSDQWLSTAGITGSPSLWNLIVDSQHPNGLGHTYIANLCSLPSAARACACH